MSSDHPKRETMSMEEATISIMWEIAALVELLEQKGLCTKHDLLDADPEVHRGLCRSAGVRSAPSCHRTADRGRVRAIRDGRGIRDGRRGDEAGHHGAGPAKGQV